MPKKQFKRIDPPAGIPLPTSEEVDERYYVITSGDPAAHDLPKHHSRKSTDAR